MSAIVIDRSDYFLRKRVQNDLTRVERIAHARIDELDRDVAKRRASIAATLERMDDDVRNMMPSDCAFPDG